MAENGKEKRQMLSQSLKHRAYVGARTGNKIMYLIDNIETLVSGNITEDT